MKINMTANIKLSLLAFASVFMLSACNEQSEPTQQQDEQELSSDEQSSEAGSSAGEQGTEMTGADDQQEQQVTEQELAEKRQQIRDIIRPPRASDITQCKLVGLGSRPCGGPERYVIYSTETTDETKLLPAVEEYNRMHKILNEQQGQISICEMLPEPNIALNSGMCMPGAELH
ncbi:hypothetical protein SAMN06297229_0578 [Pseudidiomarina planktonica]|uniref:Uncharacterized protein n=1 Tax=Pseudidiomarina planktonica TaxID=1323738 RepID=A0A1Y6EG15_9GAMM|nr:hypothetical protein [Pseudidiomarina planktonica]RUO65953.1 hypothetical protein CWI77_05870 [Pseudidiomarina planktonica]SMQ61544.1 hypothetical protein SAMN06297229_0578 [Pseudidiomarina planktonica]